MTAFDRRKTLVALAVLGWAAVVLAVYYVVHKPFTVSEIQALAGPALAVAGLALTAVNAHWLGQWLTPLFPPLAPREKLALQVGMGLGVLALLMLILGAAGGYWSWLIWIAAVAGTLIGVRSFAAELPNVSKIWPRSRAGQALAAFVLATLLYAFINALAPPTAWDALVYHLTGPKLYVQAHRLGHDLDLPYLGFPQWGSMLFTWGMLLSGPVLAQLIHWSFMLLTVALLPAAVKPIVPGRGWLAAGILAAVPSATLLAGWAYVDWLTMFAGLAAFVCLLRIDEAAHPEGPALLAGAAAGLALSAKYTAAGLVLGLAVWAMFRLRSPRLLAIFAAGILLAFGPYLLKNLALTGNPIYPFFLPGKYWDSFRAFWYSRPGTGLPLATVLFAAWDMTAWGVEGAELAGKVSYNATIGPLLLVLIPLAALSWRSRTASARRGLAGLVLVCGLAYAGWSLQVSFSGLLVQSRLLFPILPLAVILAVVGFDGLGVLNAAAVRAQFVMGGLVAATLVLTAVDYATAFFQKPVLPVVLGWQSQSDFLGARLGVYAVAIDTINSLPAGSKVVFLWEPRSYYCSGTIECEPDALLDRWWHLRRLGLTGDEVVQQWQAAGVTHVLIYELGRSIIERVGFDPLTREDWAQLQSLRGEHLRLHSDLFGVYELYELR